jgi:hypothetical protein
VAQGLAFLFGAPPTLGGPVCLRTRLRATSLPCVMTIMGVFWVYTTSKPCEP